MLGLTGGFGNNGFNGIVAFAAHYWRFGRGFSIGL